MLRNKNVTLTFLLSKVVSLMIRIINDTTLESKKVSVTFLLRNIIVTLQNIK